jgi:hypothetical protein
MMRFFGLAVLLTILSACAAQPPRAAADLSGAPPFQAVAPAGFCLSDEADPLALAFTIGMDRSAPPDRRVLAVFRPCGEPALQKGLKSWNSFRVIYQIEAGPPADPGRPAMDRETYLTFMANPKLVELWNRRNLPALQERGSPQTAGARYLGSDGEAVYSGILITPPNPAPGVVAEARIVLGQTLIGRTALRSHVVNLSANSTPADWSRLQAIATQAIHATIAAAERSRPGVAVPVSPAPPAASAGTGLTT